MGISGSPISKVSEVKAMITDVTVRDAGNKGKCDEVLRSSFGDSPNICVVFRLLSGMPN